MDKHQRNAYIKTLVEKSDREILELQSSYLYEIKENSNRIKNNIVFFFWVALAGVIFTVVLVLNTINTMANAAK